MSPVFNEAKYRALLEKLEISEVNLSDLEKSIRLDSEFYSKAYLQLQNTLEKLKSKSLNEYCVSISDGNHMSISAYFSEDGIPYYRGQDIYNFFIEQSPCPLRVPEEIFNAKYMKRSHLHQGDILMSIVGAIIGNIAIVSEKFPAICSCKLAIIRPQPAFKTIIAFFLKSSFGHRQIERLRRGGGQTGFLLEDFPQLQMPDFTVDFRKKVDSLATDTYDKYLQAINCYKTAEHLLLQELGLTDWQPDDESVATKTFADFQNSGRLDAEYYQPKYDEYLAKVKSYSGGVSTLANHFEQNKAITTFSLPQYNYIEIGDINVGNGEASFNLVQTEELPANAKYVIQQGDILISKVRPYRGAVSIIDFEPQNVIASGAFTILRENGAIRKEVLSTLLRTPLYKDWLLKWNVGSSYPVIKDEDILNLTIPAILSRSKNSFFLLFSAI